MPRLLFVFLALLSSSPLLSAERSGGWRLESATSPYLRQHASNPVEWYPWGEEAFARAREEGKPIFLSIGYSTCHWCHVMERESFSSPDVAEVLNENFISIKVDREERPDLDSAYLGWIAATGGETGWPANLILTPDLVPFWGGTYLPPEARNGLPGLKQVLHLFADQWRADRSRIAASADQMRTLVEQLSAAQMDGDLASLAETSRQRSAAMFDRVNGGFGAAPRFPQPSRLMMLLGRAAQGDAQAGEMVELTLDRILTSALHDRLRGGFHRYSLDDTWSTPHYEKMLYDQAQMARLLTEASIVLERPDYLEIAGETLRFVDEAMRLENGAWASALAAEGAGPEGSEIEGGPYLWREADVAKVVGAADARLIALRFGLTEEPRPLHVTRSIDQIADLVKVERVSVESRLQRALERLEQASRRRPDPFRDEKVLVAWNAMNISANARYAAVTGDAKRLSRAAEAAQFILTHNRDADGGLTRVWSDGAAGTAAFADDYGQLIQALLDLYESSGESRWLEHAIRTGAELESALAVKGKIVRGRQTVPLATVSGADEGDSAEPHWSGVVVEALSRLASITLDDAMSRHARNVVSQWTPTIAANPQQWPNAIEAFAAAGGKGRQIVVSAGGEKDELQAMLGLVHGRWRRGEVLLLVKKSGRILELLPHLESMRPGSDVNTVYVCENYSCKQPVTTVQGLRAQLSDAFEPELTLSGVSP